MLTMYETLMDLPLFKGIGEEQLSQLLEKTSMEFLKFRPGEIINERGGRVKGIDFILNGKVKVTYSLQNYDISIEEEMGKGRLLGAMNLFGMETTYHYGSEALDSVSIMRLEKSQYMNILKSDGIYILNFVNYLSAHAQKSPMKILGNGRFTIGRLLDNLAFNVASRKAEKVIIRGKDAEIARYCGVGISEYSAWKYNNHSEDKEDELIILKKA